MGALTIRDGESVGIAGGARIGGGLQLEEGANEFMGVATLVNGAVTVANTSVTANSRIFLSVQTPGGTPGSPLRVSARVPATSFTISTAAADTSVIAWMLVEPAS
jgi:hypothetical protein